VTQGFGRVCFIENLGMQLARRKLVDLPGQPGTWVTRQNPVEIYFFFQMCFFILVRDPFFSYFLVDY
jgi:hypothetical protein